MWTNAKLAAFYIDFGFEPFCTRPEAAELYTILESREKLLAIMEGFLAGNFRGIAGKGLVVLTDKRIIFFRKSVIGKDTLLEIQVSRVRSVMFDEQSASLEVGTEKGKTVFTQCNRRLAIRLTDLMNKCLHGKRP